MLILFANWTAFTEETSRVRCTTSVEESEGLRPNSATAQLPASHFLHTRYMLVLLHFSFVCTQSIFDAIRVWCPGDHMLRGENGNHTEIGYWALVPWGHYKDLITPTKGMLGRALPFRP